VAGRAEGTHWSRRSLTIPPDSLRAWVTLAAWELWMGMLLCGFLAFGARLVITSPDRIVVAEDLSPCYATTVVLPCERVLYRTGGLNAAFSVLCGVMLMGAAAWFLWELWIAVEPNPITDDFLKLLNDSFARNWRDPRTWPWARLRLAYGFALVGVVLTAGAAAMISARLSSSHTGKVPAANVETVERFRLVQ
jgi:hypothetical protein